MALLHPFSSRTSRMIAAFAGAVGAGFLAVSGFGQSTTGTESYIIGVLQSTPARAAADRQAGISVATVELAWQNFEPRPGDFEKSYIQEIKGKIDSFRAAGLQVQLDLGIQYPPPWVKDIPDARYVSQYGAAYIDPDPGKDIVNQVFNARIRQVEAEYVRAVFQNLGTDFYAVRLGWGYFGELGYPGAAFQGETNCYWGYDSHAQGKAPGLPAGVEPCPCPGWKPGAASEGHQSARLFAEWYLSALANCQEWEIQTVRHYYRGRLPVLYGSWGIRNGIEDAEVATDLGNQKQTEMQLGYDFDRLVGSIGDSNTIPYTTWLDANPLGCNDEGSDPRRWSPVHYLAHCASLNPRGLKVWGENTGRNDKAALDLCFRRMRDYHLIGLNWAFEGDLYDPQDRYATSLDMEEAVKALLKSK